MNNKEIIQRFYDEIFNGHQVASAVDFLKEDYIQHNSGIGTGREGFIRHFRDEFFKKYPNFKTNIKRIIAEGEYVVVYLNATGTNIMGANPERGLAIVDIYRFENGKLAEHWDVVQPVPEKSENSNTMF